MKMLSHMNTCLCLCILGFVVWFSVDSANELKAIADQIRGHDGVIAELKRSRSEMVEAEEAQWVETSKQSHRFVVREAALFKKAMLAELERGLGGLVDERRIKSFVLEEVERQIDHVTGDPSAPQQNTTAFVATLKNYAQKFLKSPGGHFVYFEPEVRVLGSLEQSSAALVEHVRRNLLLAPPSRSSPYALEHPNKMDRTAQGQLAAFLDIFKNTSSGFFVEYPAGDGELWSNTLDLEMRRNWTGLLIEPHPSNFRKILKKSRKAFLLPACLSPNDTATMLSFNDTVTRVVEAKNRTEKPKFNVTTAIIEVHCMPLHSILLALGRRVDLLILDAGSSGLRVLRTLPWEHVDVSVALVKVRGCCGSWDSEKEIEQLMLSKNFRPYAGSKTHPWIGTHQLFVRKNSTYDTPHP